MFASGFVQSFILIFISEIGDKTFILVTIYAAKMRWWIVLTVSSLGMCLMHSLSTGLGTIFILFIPKLWT
jgi:putative Ca2+/H+ antiporter (TMEM165/GDT1 family)